MLLNDVEFHAHLDLSTETCIVFLQEADKISDWNQEQHEPSAASASTTRLQYNRLTYWILNRNQSKLAVFFFPWVPVWNEVKSQPRQSVKIEMQKANVSALGLPRLSRGR